MLLKKDAMIQHSSTSWQRELADSFSKVPELLKFLEIDANKLPFEVDEEAPFSCLVPVPFAELMEKSNVDDPLLRQVLPISKENEPQPLHFKADPLEEASTNLQKGFIHKYHGRALLLVSGHCAVNCRYCFRRHFPYSDNQLSKEQWRALLDDIKNDSSISELILSGGDPLTANDKFLEWLVDEIASLGTIKRLRIHTRLPVVIPSRITDATLKWLTHPLLKVTMVLHINHPNEIGAELVATTHLLHSKGIHLFNQGVLLKGVNDSVAVLEQLSYRLYDANIIPYYMFKLDPVTGSAHFELADDDIQQLQQQLWARLPGYLMPKFSVELPNLDGKQWL